MALSDRVTDRISNNRLVNLTRGEGDTATTIDATLLGLAATDAEALFQLEAGLLYDENNPIHVTTCVWGVITVLHEWKGIGGEFSIQATDRWKRGLGLLRKRHVVPLVSSSKYTPSPEPTGRPPLDRANMAGFVANPQPTGTSDPMQGIND